MNKGPKLVVDLRESSKNRCHYLEVCCHPDDKLKPLDAAIHMEHNQCGISNVGGVFMTLTGGRLETSFAEFAWTAAILDAGHNFLCNGVLISRKVVMTTATCLTTEEPLIVRAGDWDLVTDREAVQHENRTVKDRVVHQQFRWDSTQYNIALLILTEEFPRLQHIVPVCLAPMTPVDLDKESCFVCGWNHRIVSKTPSARNIVLKMEMDIDKSSWSNNSRSTILEGTPRSEQPVYAKGAPLVCPTESSRYYLVGIWSTSLNGGTQFTDVRQFRLWINRELRPFNIFL
ncbi:phenoloxidase-activating factor 2-like [Drosophila ficusphila]|uniref:phenoloxidase-activating factor 2-like n=1 Tax=Drosophila ficusphila TaxID=30025 RepID=UPI001C8A6308|nr:phenoloxidase-activating factor 2-like [Drosophila ficusphila]